MTMLLLLLLLLLLPWMEVAEVEVVGGPRCVDTVVLHVAEEIR
jgi:hypothetical protein